MATFASSIFCQELGVKCCSVSPSDRLAVKLSFSFTPGDESVQFLSVLWVGYLASESLKNEDRVSIDMQFL